MHSRSRSRAASASLLAAALALLLPAPTARAERTPSPLSLPQTTALETAARYSDHLAIGGDAAGTAATPDAQPVRLASQQTTATPDGPTPAAHASRQAGRR